MRNVRFATLRGHRREAVSLKLKLGRDLCVQFTYPPSFTFLCLIVRKLSCWHTNKRANKHTNKQIRSKTATLFRYDIRRRRQKYRGGVSERSCGNVERARSVVNSPSVTEIAYNGRSAALCCTWHAQCVRVCVCVCACSRHCNEPVYLHG